MPSRTLVIHTPQYRVSEGARSFESVLETRIGIGYALTSEMSQLPPGTPVVLLRKDSRKRRAEGRLVSLKSTGNVTSNGRIRYDVHIDEWIEVPYKPEPLDRFGVNLI